MTVLRPAVHLTTITDVDRSDVGHSKPIEGGEELLPTGWGKKIILIHEEVAKVDADFDPAVFCSDIIDKLAEIVQ